MGEKWYFPNNQKGEHTGWTNFRTWNSNLFLQVRSTKAWTWHSRRGTGFSPWGNNSNLFPCSNLIMVHQQIGRWSSPFLVAYSVSNNGIITVSNNGTTKAAVDGVSTVSRNPCLTLAHHMEQAARYFVTIVSETILQTPGGRACGCSENFLLNSYVTCLKGVSIVDNSFNCVVECVLLSRQLWKAAAEGSASLPLKAQSFGGEKGYQPTQTFSLRHKEHPS